MSTALAELDLRVTLADHLSDLIAAYQVAGMSPRTISLFDIHIRHLIGIEPTPRRSQGGRLDRLWSSTRRLALCEVL